MMDLWVYALVMMRHGWLPGQRAFGAELYTMVTGNLNPFLLPTRALALESERRYRAWVEMMSRPVWSAVEEAMATEIVGRHK